MSILRDVRIDEAIDDNVRLEPWEVTAILTALVDNDKLESITRWWGVFGQIGRRCLLCGASVAPRGNAMLEAWTRGHAARHFARIPLGKVQAFAALVAMHVVRYKLSAREEHEIEHGFVVDLLTPEELEHARHLDD